MKVTYKLDVLSALKQAGYSSYILREKKILGEATIQRLRKNQSVSFDVIAKICTLLRCNVSDLLVCLDEPSIDSKFLKSISDGDVSDSGGNNPLDL